MKALAIVLTAFLLAIQAQLWFGKGGLGRTAQLREQLKVAEANNVQARARNAKVEAELRDLREGLEMVEEKARFELGLIKPDEIYVRVQR
ncbi:MAG TPA: septum formation initiator family protein [Burkholderiaceae bacterium]